MNRIILLAAALGLPFFFAPSAQAQMMVPAVATCGTPPQTYNAGTSYLLTQDTTGKLCINATVSATATINGGFTAANAYTPIAATTGGASTTISGGSPAAVVATNVGTTNMAYCALGASATTSSQPIAPNGGWFQFQVGGATQLTCVTSTSTTTVNVTGGTGLATGTGGGGGGGGSVPTGSAGSPNAAVVTVQGISGATALKVDGSAVTQPVSGTFWQATQPVSGTFWQSTQPVSAASLPLPSGAATAANQTSVQSSPGSSASTAVTIQGSASGVAIPVTGSLSASFSGFTPTPSYSTLAATTSTARVALPTGTTVVVYNVGSNAAYTAIGSGSVTAATSNDAINPGCWLSYAVGSAVDIAAITASGSTTLNLSGGAGLPTGGCASTLSVGTVTLGAGTNIAGKVGVLAHDASTSLDSAAGTPNGQALTIQGNASGVAVPTSLAALPALAAGANTIGAVTQASGPWSTNLTQVGGSTGYAPLAGGSAPTNGIAVVAVYNSSAPTLTTGQAAGLQLTSAGSLHTTVDNTNANGQTTMSASAPVVIASDQSAVATKAASGAFASGSIASGALASGSISSGAAVSGAFVAGAIADLAHGQGTMSASVPVAIASNQTSIPVTVASGGIASGAIASGAAASGAFASGALVDLTNLTGTKAAGTAAADSLLAGSVYNSSPLTLTTGQQAALQSDSSGYLNVHIQAGAGSGGTALTDNTAFGQSSTSETPIGCLYISAYTAATSGRSTIPQCDSNGRLIVNVNSLPALAAGANTIGAVTQASGPWTQNQTQVNSVAISTGAGATGTGTQRVGVAQDTTTIAGSAPGTAGTASTNVVTVQGVASMTPVATNMTQIGGATGYGPLAGGTAPTNGIGILGQYNSSAPTLTNGQVAAVQFDVNGNVKVAGQGLAQGSATSGQAGSLVLAASTTAPPSYTTAQSNPLSSDLSGNLRVVTPAIICNNHTFKHITTATDTAVVTGVASQIVYICGIEPKFAGTATVYVENDGGTSSSCGDTLTQIGGLYSGVAQSFPGFYAPTWGGFKNTSGNGVCLKSTGTGGVDVDIWWAQQ